MKKSFTVIIMATTLALGGCNSVYVKPNTMEPGGKVHSIAGGYSMKRSIKERLEKRGYTITVGKNRKLSAGSEIDWERYDLPDDVQYVASVTERREWINPLCVLNGLWWWNFNVSIADQKTGEELMTWRGRGCADSSMRLLRRTLNQLETSQAK